MSNEKSCLARLWYLTRPQNDIDLKNNNCKDDNADYRHINKPHEILFFYELRGKLVNEIKKESRMSCFLEIVFAHTKSYPKFNENI